MIELRLSLESIKNMRSGIVDSEATTAIDRAMEAAGECNICHDPFTINRRGQKYCSGTCKQRATDRRKRERLRR